ncbi:sugar phosphate isomerase/epimerase family protein [Stenotrophomonas sp. CFBP 13725]|uniref:sugar phosphate isomerase/epimerase family protein n=1 Tax=Stenotrophomonas sp. CFBP 13725 TaxID=2775297 RepID=UPI0017868FE3|nr:sugar phosphate isomerase/epimerase family protein [Stenotrophomonas sp. CFBP 13725]MBD8635738.1 sugar phosphate isomerase/epimerase [Stenotrophomonas sp. CFBP 13725]
MRLTTSPRFLNTVLLGGGTSQKLAAAASAGFDQVEIWRQDVEPTSAAAVRSALQDTAMGLTDVQVLLDFDGAPDPHRRDKRHEAIGLLDLAAALGARTVLVPASTDTRCIGDRVGPDLRWLCAEAGSRGLRIAYEGMAWSVLNSTLPAVWRQVQAVDADNLDIVVDAFHLFAAGRSVDDLRGIPAHRIALVQLSDVQQQPLPGHVIDTARHARCLPGEGIWPVHELLDALQDMGYSGPVGLEVFNDALKAEDVGTVAQRAMDALDRVLSRR